MSKSWKRELLREGVEPNPGPSIDEVEVALVKKYKASPLILEKVLKVFEALKTKSSSLLLSMDLPLLNVVYEYLLNRKYELEPNDDILFTSEESIKFAILDAILKVDLQVKRRKDISSLFTSQQHLFTTLNEVYESWKKDKTILPLFLQLPELPSYPKDFSPKKCLIRSVMFEIFQRYEENHTNKQSGIYGYYLGGPMGIGKSVIMYCITCLAYARNWLTLYVPRCDEWVSRNSEDYQNFYLLQTFADWIYCQSPRSVSRLSDILTDGLASHGNQRENRLADFFEELVNYDQKPVMVIFDEINGIYESKKQNYGFFKYATHFNRIVLRRGWKLISATGHAKFIESIPSGLHKYVIRLEPWSNSEFVYLLKSSDHCNPHLLKILQTKSDWIPKLCTVLGNIPRQLTILNDQSTHVAPTNNIKEMFTKLIESYEKEATSIFELSNYLYLDSLPPEQREQHMINILQTLSFASKIHISHHYLDLSILYYNFSLDRCIPLNPSAGRALIYNLRNFDMKTKDPDVKTILRPDIIPDEKTLAFERVMTKAIIFGSQNIKWCDFSNQNEQTVNLNCDVMFPIEPSMLLPTTVPSQKTILVPVTSKYPIADLIVADSDQQQIYLLQITISHPTCKLPLSSKPYYAIFNRDKWQNLLTNYPNYKAKGNNYAEELLRYIGVDSVVTIENNQLVERNTKGEVVTPHFHYIVITPKPWDTNIEKEYNNFPWIKLVHGGYLAKFLSDQIVAGLLEN